MLPQTILKFFQQEKWLPKQYDRLLNLLIVLFLASAFLEDGDIGSLIFSTSLLIVILALISSLQLERGALWLCVGLASTAFLLDSAWRLDWLPEYQTILAVANNTIYSIFLAIAVFLLIRRLFKDKEVTADTIKGGICIYLLVGFLWSLVYSAIYSVQPQAFSPSGTFDPSYDMVYFSFTTLTTLGYGDVVPLNKLVRVLANLEAIAGLMYPAVFIARLVSLYTARELEK